MVCPAGRQFDPDLGLLNINAHECCKVNETVTALIKAELDHALNRLEGQQLAVQSAEGNLQYERDALSKCEQYVASLREGLADQFVSLNERTGVTSSSIYVDIPPDGQLRR